MIPVPVRSPDADARLDLQAVLDRIYDDAGYADYIYEGTPRPKLAMKTRNGLASSSAIDVVTLRRHSRSLVTTRRTG